MTIWNEGVFNLGQSTLDDLIRAVDSFDFAIFVFAPDDLTRIRKTEQPSVRDNVVFELGLFMGRLGKQRCFWVVARGDKAPHIPTDLIGINTASFTPRENLRSAVGSACAEIKRVIRKAGRRTDTQVEELDQPMLLCAASPLYAKYDFDGDSKAMNEAFPGRVSVEASINGSKLRQLLANSRWDVVHLVVNVHSVSGSIILSDRDHEERVGETSSDIITAEGVAALLHDQQVRLVVLATCDSLALAARLTRVTNVIAGIGWLDGKRAAEWAQLFYGFLARGRSLASAFDLSQKATDVPLVLLTKRDFRLALPTID